MGKKISKYLGWVLTLVFLVVIAVKLYNDYNDSNEIDANTSITEGEIVDYYIVGTHSPHLIYRYTVEGKEYTETLKLFSKFKGCEETKECIGRKFTVYYSSKNPEKSKIDFDQEVK